MIFYLFIVISHRYIVIHVKVIIGKFQFFLENLIYYF
jgi:hypothetical protein